MEQHSRRCAARCCGERKAPRSESAGGSGSAPVGRSALAVAREELRRSMAVLAQYPCGTARSGGLPNLGREFAPGDAEGNRAVARKPDARRSQRNGSVEDKL